MPKEETSVQDEINELLGLDEEGEDESSNTSDDSDETSDETSDEGGGDEDESDSEEVSEEDSGEEEGEEKDSDEDSSPSDVDGDDTSDSDDAVSSSDSGDAGSSGESSDELEALKQQNAALLARINEMSGTQKTEITPKDQTNLEKVFEKLDLDTVIDKKENFIEFFTGFAKAIQAETSKQVIERVPDVTQQVLTRKQAMNDVRDNFYKEHPELVNVKQYVAVTANTVASENPDWKIPEVLEEAAKRSRDALGINKLDRNSPVITNKKKPAFAKPKGGQRSKAEPKVSKLQQELDDFNADIM